MSNSRASMLSFLVTGPEASVDSRVIVRELREETLELRQLPSLGLDDGVGVWRHL